MFDSHRGRKERDVFGHVSISRYCKLISKNWGQNPHISSRSRKQNIPKINRMDTWFELFFHWTPSFLLERPSFCLSVSCGRASTANVCLPSQLLSSCNTLIGAGSTLWLHFCWEQKKNSEKKRKKNSFNYFCLSRTLHLPLLLQGGNWKRPANVSGRQSKPSWWLKHSGAEKSPACSPSLNDCLINRSNLGFWLSRHFWRVGEMGQGRNYFSSWTENRWEIGE